MECTVHWTGSLGGASGMGFLAQTGSGHWVTMDGPPDLEKPSLGGANLAPRPMELILAGTGACTAYDVVLILRKGRHAIHDCTVKIKAERATSDPKVFTQLHLHFVVKGHQIPELAIERAITLSCEKYCSALAMLGHTAQITTSFEVHTESHPHPGPDSSANP
jgi:putative redox protein